MEFLAFILLISALIWGLVFLKHSGLWGCLLLTLITGTVFGHFFFHRSAFTLDRGLLALCSLLFLFSWFWGLLETKGWNRSDLLFSAFVMGMVTTTLLAIRSPESASSVSKLVFFFLIPSSMYLFASRIRLSIAQLRGAFLTFALLGLYLSLTGLAEKYDVRGLVFPRYISDPNHIEFYGRGRGPLLNPVGNGILITLAMSCVLVISGWFPGWKRLLILSTIPIYLGGLYSSMTRCVWIGGALALVGIGIAMSPRKMRIPLLVGTLVVGCLGIGAKASSLNSFKRDKHVSVEDMRQSASLRPMLAYIAWKMFQDRPLFGCGTGQYRSEAKIYFSERDIDMPLDKARPYVQHNMFLALLVENGLVGLGPFFFVLLLWGRKAWQIWCSPSIPLEVRQLGLVFLGTLAAYVANGLFHDVLIIPMMNAFFFFLAGILRNKMDSLGLAIASTDSKGTSSPMAVCSRTRTTAPQLA